MTKQERIVLRECMHLEMLARRAGHAADLHALITNRPLIKAHLEVRGCIDVRVHGRDCDGFRFDYERPYVANTPPELEQAFIEDAQWADGPISFTPVV